MLDKKKHVLEAKNTYFMGLTVLGNNWVFFWFLGMFFVFLKRILSYPHVSDNFLFISLH